MTATFAMPDVLDDEPAILSFPKGEADNSDSVDQPGASAELPFAPCPPREFFDFKNAEKCYAEYVNSVPPGFAALSFKKFWFESEKHIHGKEFVPWSFAGDHRWVKGERGEICASARVEKIEDESLINDPYGLKETLVAQDESTSDDSDDRFWKELELLGRLKKAEREREELQSEHDSLKEELKGVKDELKAATLKVSKIAAEIARQASIVEVDESEAKLHAKQPTPRSTVDANDSNLLTEPSDVEDQQPSMGSEPTVEPEDTDNTWRTISTTEVAKGIKGVGAKKIDALATEYPTLGDLEDARAAASVSFKQFKEVLPDGWGETAANALEDRMMQMLFKDQPRPSDKQTEPAKPLEAVQEQPEHSEPVAAQSSEPPAVVATNEPDLSDL